MRTRPTYDNQEYAAMLGRLVRRYAGRLVAPEANEMDLADAVALRRLLDDAITAGARAQADRTSWAEVAKGLGTSRQGAWRKYGERVSA